MTDTTDKEALALASRAYRTRQQLEEARAAMAEAYALIRHDLGEHPHAVALDLLRMVAEEQRRKLRLELQTIRMHRRYAGMKNKGRTYREAIDTARDLMVGLNELRRSIAVLDRLDKTPGPG